MELRIFDKRVDGSGLIVPLSMLLRQFEAVCPSALTGKWEVLPGSHGYGATICEWEDKLDSGKRVLLPANDLFSVLLGEEEYFYWGHLRTPEGVEIGIKDSTFLYARGDKELLDSLSSGFVKFDFCD